MTSDSISNVHLKKFSDEGVLYLKGFIPKQLVLSAKHSVLSDLTRLKLLQNGKLAASKIQDLPLFQQTTRLGKMVGHRNEVGRLFTDELSAVLSSLVKEALKPALSQPQLLLSFPHKAEWSLKQLSWHLDIAPSVEDLAPGVQAFILIDDVHQRGGGTLALAGSHKLHHIDQRSNVHEVLRLHSDFSSDPDKYLEPQVIKGRRVQILEMYGRAGDIYLMDLRVLHAPSINAGRKLRMMATNRYLRR